MGDRRKCQTYTASPAEPGGLPVMLENLPVEDESQCTHQENKNERHRHRPSWFSFLSSIDR
jgi:hypothetical protein